LFLPEVEPLRSRIGREVARMLLHLAGTREGRRGMLIAEINGAPATANPASRLFIQEGFAATAMGLQARTDRLRPRGYGSLELELPGQPVGSSGIGIAADDAGGAPMAEQGTVRNDTLENTRPRANENSDSEHDRVRASNDQDQEMEREGVGSERNRGYDEAVRGEDLGDVDSRDVDPDSAESQIDRDDTMDE
jgi:hypothetical protein